MFQKCLMDQENRQTNMSLELSLYLLMARHCQVLGHSQAQRLPVYTGPALRGLNRGQMDGSIFPLTTKRAVTSKVMVIIIPNVSITLGNSILW